MIVSFLMLYVLINLQSIRKDSQSYIFLTINKLKQDLYNITKLACRVIKRLLQEQAYLHYTSKIIST